MIDVLQHLFAGICGQNPDHTWSPGGIMLPCCQRCTGLYAGAFVAALLHSTLRPAPTNRWLWLNGGLLLVMIPFGFHWLPQGAGLRTITGVAFGFGLVGYFWLPLRSGVTAHPAAKRAFLTVFLATTALVPWMAAQGNALIGHTLWLAAAGGGLALFGLVLANVVLAMRWTISRLRESRLQKEAELGCSQ